MLSNMEKMDGVRDNFTQMYTISQLRCYKAFQNSPYILGKGNRYESRSIRIHSKRQYGAGSINIYRAYINAPWMAWKASRMTIEELFVAYVIIFFIIGGAGG